MTEVLRKVYLGDVLLTKKQQQRAHSLSSDTVDGQNPALL